MPLWRFFLLFGGVTLALTVSLAPGAGAANPADPIPPVFFSAHGKCALQYRDNEPAYCRRSKFGNAFLPSYTSPRPGEWGITYAYNCGKKARKFYVVVDLTLWDQSVSTMGFGTKGRKGKGYYMETGKDATSIAVANGESDGYWGSLENVVINSPCRWSVKGVDGPESVVAQYVPSIPKKS